MYLSQNVLLILVALTVPIWTHYGKWSAWHPWGPCSLSCGTGVRQRYRLCESTRHLHCQGESNMTSSCLQYNCPVDGKWSQWLPWSPCSAPCGNGIKQRIRLCNSPTPANEGKLCSGIAIESFACKQDPCTVDGQWSQWLPWSFCSASCGNGIKQRIRLCNSPSPSIEGKQCSGTPLESLACEQDSCAVDGQWSQWLPWSSCSASCGNGTKQRIRLCNSPTPANEGKLCSGTPIESLPCKQDSCEVDGQWGAWHQFTLCTVTCGGGAMGQSRYCNSPSPNYGGKSCQGHQYRTISCNTQSCPAIDGNWGHWERATLCTKSCGGGVMGQRRSCDTPPPKYGGRPCKGEAIRIVSCNTAQCPTTNHLMSTTISTESTTKQLIATQTTESTTKLTTSTTKESSTRRPTLSHAASTTVFTRTKLPITSRTISNTSSKTFTTRLNTTSNAVQTTQTTKLTTAFQQATKARSTSQTPKFAWQTIYIPGR